MSDSSLITNTTDYLTGLQKLKELQPISYTYKPGTPFSVPDSGETFIGFVAQHLNRDFPEAVDKRRLGDSDCLQVELSLLIPAIINALRELDKRLVLIEAWEGRLKTQEDKLEKNRIRSRERARAKAEQKKKDQQAALAAPSAQKSLFDQESHGIPK